MSTAFNTTHDSVHRFTAVLKDETGAAVPAASLTTLTLTLTDVATNAIINGRSAQNVLNANNVTVDSSGNLVWTGQQLDNPIINSAKTSERHRALWTWTWASGTKGAHDQTILEVQRLANVPSYPNP